MLVLPFPVHLDVVVLVARGQPLCLIVLAKRKGTKKVPDPLGTIALDLDDRIHDHVLREADVLLEGLEQLADSLMALGLTEATTLLENCAAKTITATLSLAG